MAALPVLPQQQIPVPDAAAPYALRACDSVAGFVPTGGASVGRKRAHAGRHTALAPPPPLSPRPRIRQKPDSTNSASTRACLENCPVKSCVRRYEAMRQPCGLGTLCARRHSAGLLEMLLALISVSVRLHDHVPSFYLDELSALINYVLQYRPPCAQFDFGSDTSSDEEEEDEEVPPSAPCSVGRGAAWGVGFRGPTPQNLSEGGLCNLRKSVGASGVIHPPPDAVPKGADAVTVHRLPRQ